MSARRSNSPRGCAPDRGEAAAPRANQHPRDCCDDVDAVLTHAFVEARAATVAPSHVRSRTSSRDVRVRVADIHLVASIPATSHGEARVLLETSRYTSDSSLAFDLVEVVARPVQGLQARKRGNAQFTNEAVGETSTVVSSGVLSNRITAPSKRCCSWRSIAAPVCPTKTNQGGNAHRLVAIKLFLSFGVEGGRGYSPTELVVVEIQIFYLRCVRGMPEEGGRIC